MLPAADGVAAVAVVAGEEEGVVVYVVETVDEDKPVCVEVCSAVVVEVEVED